MMMDKQEAIKLLKAYTGELPNFDSLLFPQQLDVINSPAKRIVVCNSRRSGKSVMGAHYLLKTAWATPKAECFYLALTRESAKDIMLPEFEHLLDVYNIQAKINYTYLTFTFNNGSKIRITGADNIKAAGKFKGMKRDLVYIDEAQDFNNDVLTNLINRSLIPQLQERNGTLVLAGTPGIVCAGYFYEASKGIKKQFTSYHWTLLDNPYYERWAGKSDWRSIAQKELEKIAEEEKLDLNSELFTREYKGNWVEGGSELVYKFNSELNTYSIKPNLPYNYLIAADFGVIDASAILVGAYSLDSPYLYITHEYKAVNKTPSDVATVIQTLYHTYNPVKIVGDAGGLGKAFIAQVQQQYQIPVDPAEKLDKVAFISLLNDELNAGRIKIDANCTELIKELTNFKWKDPQAKLLPDKAEDHLCDSLLYLYRLSLHYIGKIPENLPKTIKSIQSEHLLRELNKASMYNTTKIGRSRW